MRQVSKNSKYSKYRWVMQFLWILVAVCQMFSWLTLSPLLTTIMHDLGLNYAQSGILMTIVLFMSGISLFLGSFVISKLGIKYGTIASLSFFCIAGIVAFSAHNYYVLLLARILVGLGFGIDIALSGALVMTWFPPKEQSYINTVNVLVSNSGMTLAYLITIPLLHVVKEWNNIFIIISFFAAFLIVVWGIFGKSAPSLMLVVNNSEDIKQEKKQSGIVLAAKKKEVWMLSAAFFGNLMAFNACSTFLPAYLEKIRGFEMAQASSITGLLPIAGVFGSIICGVGTSILQLRKPFIWPSMVIIIIGIIGIVLIPKGLLLYLSVCAIGFGCAAFPPIFTTIVMELKGTTAEMVAGALALIIGLNHFMVILCPVIFNKLVGSVNMSNAFLAFCFPLIISTILMSILPETGPRRTRNKKLVESENVV